MKTRLLTLPTFVLLSSLLIGCAAELASSAPTSTPTSERKPTLTSTATKPPEVLSTEIPATEPPAPLPVPSPFDMSMDFTGGTCGPATYTYTFNIGGTVLDLVQTDAGITSTGTYDPITGTFSTSVDVGPGSETYDGTIAYDGTTISLSGSYAWIPDSGEGCTADISGTTTP